MLLYPRHFDAVKRSLVVALPEPFLVPIGRACRVDHGLQLIILLFRVPCILLPLHADPTSLV